MADGYSTNISGITPTGLAEGRELRSEQEIRELARSADSLSRIAGSDALSDTQKLRAVADEFESVFLNMLLKQMRRTVPERDRMTSDSVVA